MPAKTIQLSPTPQFIPSLVRGDRDFDGNGPDVFVSAWLRIVNKNQLWVHVRMRAQETESDWTTVEGSTDYFIYNGQYQDIGRITRILSDTYSYDSYRDFDHQDDERRLTSAELVEKFVVTGDTSGDEAGIRTGVIVHFNPVEIEYEPLPEAGDVVTVSDIPPLPIFVPPHVNGDRDFGGHGPNIDVSTTISIENGNEIWARVYMRAIETKSDWTEARGAQHYMIYRHDHPVLQILSDTSSSARFRDNDHQKDIVTLTGGELVRQFVITGDTKGDEAGSRTGVAVYLNPITFRQQT